MKGACSLSKRRKLKTIEEKVQGEQEEMGERKIDRKQCFIYNWKSFLSNFNND